MPRLHPFLILFLQSPQSWCQSAKLLPFFGIFPRFSHHNLHEWIGCTIFETLTKPLPQQLQRQTLQYQISVNINLYFLPRAFFTPIQNSILALNADYFLTLYLLWLLLLGLHLSSLQCEGSAVTVMDSSKRVEGEVAQGYTNQHNWTKEWSEAPKDGVITTWHWP